MVLGLSPIGDDRLEEPRSADRAGPTELGGDHGGAAHRVTDEVDRLVDAESVEHGAEVVLPLQWKRSSAGMVLSPWARRSGAQQWRMSPSCSAIRV